MQTVKRTNDKINTLNFKPCILKCQLIQRISTDFVDFFIGSTIVANTAMYVYTLLPWLFAFTFGWCTCYCPPLLAPEVTSQAYKTNKER